MRAIFLAALLVAGPAMADEKGVIWMDSTGGTGATAPKDKDVIWADTTGGDGVKQPKDKEIIWMDTTDGVKTDRTSK